MRAVRFIFFVASLTMVVFACSEQSETDRANIQFRLIDMSGEYQEVNIDIVAVNVIVNDSLFELTTNQGKYNLLEFVNGKDTLLVDDEIPGGFISQVRLVLGENNTIMIDDLLHDLKTPSAQQSGLKLNVHNEFLPGESYAYVIDFVVEKSIVETGNGGYILKPVIRVFTEVITGSVKGVISPAEANPLIMAIGTEGTTSTFADADSGYFVIRGLFEGDYSLEIQPVEGFKDTVLSNISIVPGQTIDIDTVFIQQQP